MKHKSSRSVWRNPFDKRFVWTHRPGGVQTSSQLPAQSSAQRQPQQHLGYRSVLLLLGLISCLMCPKSSAAHGGVVIDTGFTDHFEWLVSIDPYPTLMGEAMLTLLVYDIATYEPVNEMTVVAYPTVPDDAQPCCAPTADPKPIPLTIDPAQYPGDYSNLIPLDQPGDWSVRIAATAPEERSDESFAVVVTVTVYANMGGSQRIPMDANSTPDIDATATAFALNVREARQATSPLAAPNSPLAVPADSANGQAFVVETERGRNWLLWGGLGIIPILLIGWFTLRSSDDPDERSSE